MWIAAANRWGNLTDVGFSQVASSPDLLYYPGNFGPTGWDGYAPTSFSCGSSGITGVNNEVQINTYYTDSYGTYKRESVIGHEIGHYLGLAHVGSASTACASVTLMNPNTPRRYDDCGVVGPVQDDITGVNALY
jgi:predicted Zn-dependent protease